MAEVLNLNNEVVKMRKDVKKVRVLTIRKLTRHIAELKAKKGTEEEVSKNHKRAQRLLEEIHAMKKIKMDQVTKLALAKEISFETICKKPNCTARDRAIARLTTHPLLKAKIANIKAAVKAFKDARQKSARTVSSEEQKSEEQLARQSEMTQNSRSALHNKTFKHPENQDKTEVNDRPDTDMGKEQIFVTENPKAAESEKKYPSEVEPHQLPPKAQTEKLTHPVENKSLCDLPSKLVDATDSDESESEATGVGKEYFDDSTEERFYNQSSSSDESDGSDDFFIGKVKRMKKKKTSLLTEEEIENNQLKKPKISQSDPVLDRDSKSQPQRSEITKLESVFCHSLSESKKSRHVKRTVRDHLPRNKIKAFERNHLARQRTKGSGTRQGTDKKQLEQPLHPSWEASRKRREQISQITAFQGKKIKFED